jgi:hypothetical protein
MNKEQQRIAIAEACGYEFKTHEGKSYCFFEELDGWVYWENIIPHYLDDLNAMHEAEKTLSQKDKREYAYQLNGGYYTSGLDDTFDIVHATAAQRAEAFLRTIDKWTTNEPTES